jgi:hypothetical protein
VVAPTDARCTVPDHVAISKTMAQAIDLFTPNYRLRLMTPAMVTDRWVGWTADRSLMNKLNSKTLKLKKADIQRYVASVTSGRRAIIGIFRLADGDHVGLYEIALDHRHRVANLDVLIDLKRYSLNDVLSETDPVLLADLKNRFGVHKAAAMVPITFKEAIGHFESAGWLKEGVLRAEYPAVEEGKRTDAVHFGQLLVA